MIRYTNINRIISAYINVLKSLFNNEVRPILLFAARYITFCRKAVLQRTDLQIVTQILPA